MTPEEMRERRQKIGITQAELARRLGIGARHVRRLEAGETPIHRPLELAIKQVTRR